MLNALENCNEILLKTLRPWKLDYVPQKFEQLLHDLPKETYQYQPLYEASFQKAVSAKRRYFVALIRQASIRFLNAFHSEMDTALTENEKKYHVNQALNNIIKPKFSDTKKVIEKNGYTLNSINSSNDDAFIIQYLKYELIRLYLEVQDHYKPYLKDDELQVEDILTNFFSDPPAANEMIIAAEKINIPIRKVSSTPKDEKKSFQPRNFEIRDPADGVLTYEEIVAKPERLGRVEAILFDDGYIDQNFVLTDTQGNVKKMAAIAQVLYQFKFFNEITFHDGKKIKVTPRHVQQFVSHRYMTNIDQEFRRLGKPEALQEYLSNHSWIKLLPSP